MSGVHGRRLAAIAGLIAVGAATGVALEQALVGRRFRLPADSAEPFGTLRGRPIDVITDDGVKLYVEVDDPPEAVTDGLTVVFCHGYALNQHCWHYQRRDLRSLGRLVFADQRAHGLSSRGEPDRTSIDQLGQDLGAVIDAVGGDGPILLVGHSMGGMTVMALAAERPELFTDGPIEGVALLGTSAGGLSEWSFGLPPNLGHAFHQLAPLALQRAVKQQTLVERGRSIGSDLAYFLIHRYSFGSQASPALTKFTAEMINATPVDVIAEFLPGLTAHEKAEALAAMSTNEALVMVGTKDLLTPPRFSREIVRRLPHAEFIVLRDTGHMLMLERYPEVNQALRDLIARVRARHADARAGG